MAESKGQFFYNRFIEIMSNENSNLKISELQNKYKATIPFTTDIQCDDLPLWQLYWYDLKNFTSLINKSIAPAIIHLAGCSSENEYYRTDIIGWKKVPNKTGDSSDTTISDFHIYSWNLIYAIEHENDSKEWCDEFVKLQYLRAKCHILIGYVPQSKRGEKDKNGYIGDINRIKAAIKNAPPVVDFCETGTECESDYSKEEYIIILGNSDADNVEINHNFDYCGYRLIGENVIAMKYLKTN